MQVFFYTVLQRVVNFCQRVEAVFEVNTDLQRNVQAKVTAQLTWPSVINSSQHILFPLTNTNGSSVSTNNPVLVAKSVQNACRDILRHLLRFKVFLQDEVVTLQNPADVPVYIQVLPLALMPNPSVFSGKLAER